MNTWWVEYKYTYDLWVYDEDDNGGWEVCEDYDARRFRCVKKDIPKMVKEHIEEELKYDTIRYLKITITDKYITTDSEV